MMTLTDLVKLDICFLNFFFIGNPFPNFFLLDSLDLQLYILFVFARLLFVRL